MEDKRLSNLIINTKNGGANPPLTRDTGFANANAGMPNNIFSAYSGGEISDFTRDNFVKKVVTIEAATYDLEASDNQTFLNFNTQTPGATQTLQLTSANVNALPIGFQVTIAQQGDGFVSISTDPNIAIVGNDNQMTLSPQGGSISLTYLGDTGSGARIFMGVKTNRFMDVATLDASTVTAANGDFTNLDVSQLSFGSNGPYTISNQTIDTTVTYGSSGTTSAIVPLNFLQIGNFCWMNFGSFSQSLNASAGASGTLQITADVPVAYRPARTCRDTIVISFGSSLTATDATLRIGSDGDLSLRTTGGNFPLNTNIGHSSSMHSWLIG